MFPPDLPPVSNWALYVYRVIAKWLSFFLFGLASLILVIIVFPPMLLFFHPRERFKKYGRRFVSSSMRGFVAIMHFLRIVNLEADNRENYRHLSSKILVANHPSLLDVIMLLSLIPNADCIVNTYLNHNVILRGVVRSLYILNSLDIESIFQACTESLKQGNCLVIFPEGTRTPRHGKAIIRKGAARVALASGCNIVPVHIGGTDKYGLGKKDPWLGFNPRERYVYRISMGQEINPGKCRDLPAPKAVRALTKEIEAFLFPAKEGV
ncbi:MAG: 1-acyl-sn-glycerol-3-phosphate acyltransferase [Treponema sp.]|jgi:1-acyl-sn-glycerol-3-phosphate acyltransferase|nr:1-acyl-sn-glycerol-3-phosphate acyltransferase [Treponema sp.]